LSSFEKKAGRSPAARGVWSDAVRRLKANRLAMACAAVIAAYVLLVAVIYITEFFRPDAGLVGWKEIVGEEYSPPGRGCLFGTDFLGRSVLRKTLYGAKISLTVAFWASLISLAIGVPLGAVAGYFRGIVDELIVWLYTTLSSIPYILLVLAFALVLKDKTFTLRLGGAEIFRFELVGITTVYMAIGLTGWVGVCRLIRGEVIKHKDRQYVTAARSYGCGDGRIITRHIIPNVFHLVIISFSLRFVNFIQAEVILSFLGLGEKDRPSWGAMIDAARLDLPKGYWWEMTAATAAIFVISLALNIFGDALRDSLDPKLRIQ
jgi:peptide/nickel transport system permease protein